MNIILSHLISFNLTNESFILKEKTFYSSCYFCSIGLRFLIKLRNNFQKDSFHLIRNIKAELLIFYKSIILMADDI